MFLIHTSAVRAQKAHGCHLTPLATSKLTITLQNISMEYEEHVDATIPDAPVQKGI